MSIKIIENPESQKKELYLFGEYIASWHQPVDTMEVIIPYAIKEACEIGKREKAAELRKVLGLC